MRLSHIALALPAIFAALPSTLAYTSYIDTFVPPDYFFSDSFNKSTIPSQARIIQWAEELSRSGPYSVMNKKATPPSGTKHDYLSWAPYYFPNCSNVHNTTVLPVEEVWVKCNYTARDGVFNPDIHQYVNDSGSFFALADTVLYSSMAWALTNDSVYPHRINSYLTTWFIDPDTMMNPNLNYSQIHRGPDGQLGAHTGVLDLKGMIKIVTGLLILRHGNCTEWQQGGVDEALQAWINDYIPWLETHPQALEEKAAKNNHGTFYFAQLASLKLFVGDTIGARSAVEEYFTGIYMNQIIASGEQPLEAARTRPYHYRCYNIVGAFTNAKIGQYVGYDAFSRPAAQGAGIQDAVNFAMTKPPGVERAAEFYPAVAYAAAVYGDPTGKYLDYVYAGDNTYFAEGYFVWTQPLSDMGLVVYTQDTAKNAGSRVRSSAWALGAVAAIMYILL